MKKCTICKSSTFDPQENRHRAHKWKRRCRKIEREVARRSFLASRIFCVFPIQISRVPSSGDKTPILKWTAAQGFAPRLFAHEFREAKQRYWIDNVFTHSTLVSEPYRYSTFLYHFINFSFPANYIFLPTHDCVHTISVSSLFAFFTKLALLRRILFFIFFLLFPQTNVWRVLCNCVEELVRCKPRDVIESFVLFSVVWYHV